ncbi:MAG: hypothetical protein AAGG68_14575 [Bacteroidota bacterium]
MERINFSTCTLAYLEETFGLERQIKLEQLDNWLDTKLDLSKREKEQLLDFQEALQINILHWNEQELSLNFIGPIFAMVRFSHQKFNFFAQRNLSGIIQDLELYGKVDGMVASGFSYPKAPFFSFHEFKKEIDPTGDPIAQNLASMLVGQSLNHNRTPIYGCLVNGQNWYFMMLEGKKYVISRGYSSTSTELFDIFRILKSLKEIVLRLVE